MDKENIDYNVDLHITHGEFDDLYEQIMKSNIYSSRIQEEVILQDLTLICLATP